ncbi:MAG: hypothetical protein PWP65_1281 [Clostridia bacterium]|nr:hypothetical protein [Clostridia bacterium]
MKAGFHFSRVPWGARPSLKAMASEAGIDFDRFIAGLAANRTDTELAREFGVPPQSINRLREHFERYGVHSIIGQD